MLIKFKSTDYFIASAAEFSSISELNDLFPLMDENHVVMGQGGFDMVYALSRIFFSNEEMIPIEIDHNMADVSRAFQYPQTFIDKIASFEDKELDAFGYRLRDDEYCRHLGLIGMGLWVFLYELRNCCLMAVKQKKNLYLIEDFSERIYERVLEE